MFSIIGSAFLGRRIPSLDGLRATSILMVVVAHVAGTRNCFSLHSIAALGDCGNLGVRVFFVISGFLITTLLKEEYERTGSISLRSFYVRRVFRIFPAAYAFIAVMLTLNAAGLIDVPLSD